jgi:4'-phosphopantetheinyl transferase
MHFNLSHSGDLAVLAISASGPIGIDLEFIDRHIDIPGLARSCFNEAEEQSILALPVPEQAARFFAFWTAKEAHMKLSGQGMSLPPHEIALDLRDGYPVGYLRPASPFATLTYIDLGLPSATCCLALASQNSDSFFHLI